MTANVRLLQRKQRAGSLLVLRLRQHAIEFEAAAQHYARYTGTHNALLRDESHRAAAQLRLVAQFVVDGTYNAQHALHWLRASSHILNAIGRANLT